MERRRVANAEAVAQRPSRTAVRHNGPVHIDEGAVAAALRAAGARFAFVHGSRTEPAGARPDSDLDVAAWWGVTPPDAWAVRLPAGVDLLVLDTGPLWLVGRVAQYGRLLFDDDPAARVAWQADTRLRYLDERPAIEQRYRERTRQIAREVHGG